jgi:sortase (surface protein transpeptidase)
VRAYARTVALAGLVLALAAGTAGCHGTNARADSRPGAPAVSARPNPADSFTSARTYPVVALPIRLRIPALHVNSRMIRLGVQKDGTVQVPARFDVAGWYDGGPRPGQNGPAVILGHVDSKSGPGIFIDLRHVRIGTRVWVDRADGTSVEFKITKLSRVPKVQFPTDLVYAPSLDPTLRLVTCGGSFDSTRGSYRDNVIAFADLV